jgi:hypothetical protein
MPSSQPSHTTQTTEVKLPAWVDKASQENYQLAQSIADKPLVQYQGQTVAGLSDLTKQAQGILASGGTADTTGYDAATGMFNKAAGGSAYTGQAADIYAGLGTPSSYTIDANNLFKKAGQGILGLNRADYMNPFQSDVIDSTVQTSKDALSQALMGNADRAVAAKAFGGDRSAIVDGTTIAQNNKDLAALIAGLNTDNFNQATGAMQGDVGNMMNAGAGLAGLGSQDLAARTAAAGGLGALGSKQVDDWLSAGTGLSGNQTAANKDKLGQVSGLLTAGAQDQGQQQAVLDAAKGKFDEANNYDLTRLNILLSSLGMSPYGQSQNTDTKTSGGSSGTDFASMGMGLMSLLFGISDERLKKDKRRVGTKVVRGKKVPIYKYHYIGDPKDAPFTRGPMAQDLEKVIPEHVANVGGVKMVDRRVLGALAS